MKVFQLELDNNPQLIVGYIHPDLSEVVRCLFEVLHQGIITDDPDTWKLFGVLACTIESIKIAHPDVAEQIRSQYILPLRKEWNDSKP